MIAEIFPFYNFNDVELLSLMNDDSKLEFVKYCNIKFDLLDSNRYLENNDNYTFYGNVMNNECNYTDVEDFLQLPELNSNEPTNKFISLFLYIRSISKNLSEFIHDFVLNEKRYDVLCFAETRLTESITPLFQLEGFSMYSNPRNSHGGGVVIYVSRAHCSTKISDITLMEDEIESVFASMISRKKNIL